MKSMLKPFSIALLMIFIFSLVLLCGAQGLARIPIHTQKYDRSFFLDASFFIKQIAPVPQVDLQKKFAEFNYVNSGELRIFSSEQASDLISRKKGGELFTLNRDEIIFLVNDSVQLYFKYDSIILTGGDRMQTTTDKVITSDYKDISELEDLSEIGEYERVLNDICDIILYRISMLDSTFSKGEIYKTVDPVTDESSKWLVLNSDFSSTSTLIEGYGIQVPDLSDTSISEFECSFYLKSLYKTQSPSFTEYLEQKQLTEIEYLAEEYYTFHNKYSAFVTIMTAPLFIADTEDSIPTLRIIEPNCRATTILFPSAELSALQPSREGDVTLEPENKDGNIEWLLSDDGVLYIKGKGRMNDYSDYFGSEAPWCSDRSDIKSVVIEEGVTSIGNYAFNKCEAIESVIIPESVVSIGNSAFIQCRRLEGITIPDSVTSMGFSAFKLCTHLKSVTIGSGVRSIGSSAFDCCIKLENITIPEGVTRIESKAFFSCKALASIILPEGLASIESYAFANCIALTSITIPENVISIGESAFASCHELSSIIIEGDTSIGSSVFQRCTGLTSVTLSDGITSIGKYAFGECTGLTGIKLPDSITSIGDHAFSECTSLTSITLPQSVTSIDHCSFYGCSAITGVTIPGSVREIKGNPFAFCSQLESITVSSENTIYHSDGDCLIETESKILISGCAGSVIPSDGSVTVIGKSAFRGCNKLESIIIPDGITSIGSIAFEGCIGLTSVTISESVISIGWNAFESCTELTSITIPKSVTIMESYVFSKCEKLKKIYCSVPSAPSGWNSKWKAKCSAVVVWLKVHTCTPNRKKTCTQDILCASCGKFLEQARGHNYVDYVCTVCGEYKKHDCIPEKEVGCREKSVCKLCRRILTPKGHEYLDGVCTVCGWELIHDCKPKKEATCTESSVCKICKKTVEPAKGHSYVEKVCSVCGAVEPPFPIIPVCLTVIVFSAIIVGGIIFVIKRKRSVHQANRQ